MIEDVTPEEWVDAHARARELPFRYPALRVSGIRFSKYCAWVTEWLPAADTPVPDELIQDGLPKLDSSVPGRLRAAAKRDCPTAWAAVERVLAREEAVPSLVAGAVAAGLAERRRPDPFMLRLLSTDCDCIDAPTHVLSTLVEARFVWSVEELHSELKPSAVHAARVRHLARLVYRHAPFPRFRRVSDKLQFELEYLDRHPRLAYDVARIVRTCAQTEEQLRPWAEAIWAARDEASG